MRNAFRVLCFGILAISGCDLFEEEQGPELSLHVDKNDYAIGDTLQLLLVNTSSKPVIYNLCHASLEQKKESRWEEIPESKACTDIGFPLAPRKVAVRREVETTSHAGQYRFVYEIRSGSSTKQYRERVLLYSNTFEVHASG